MTDARGTGPNTLRMILDSYGLKLIKTHNTVDNVGKSPEMVLCERVSIRPRDYVARWSPDIGPDEWEEPYVDEKRQAAGDEAIAALDIPQCKRCRGTGYRLVNNAFKTHETCEKCDGSGRQNT